MDFGFPFRQSLIHDLNHAENHPAYRAAVAALLLATAYLAAADSRRETDAVATACVAEACSTAQPNDSAAPIRAAKRCS